MTKKRAKVFMVFSLISLETSPGILFPGSKGVAKTGTNQIDFSVFSFHLVAGDSRVVTWYMGAGLKAQNMTGIRAQNKGKGSGLRAQKNGIRDHKAFEP